MCDCKFNADPLDPDEEDTPEKSWHYRRVCASCGQMWFGLHCPHDGVQNPCPGCGVKPTRILDEDFIRAEAAGRESAINLKGTGRS